MQGGCQGLAVDHWRGCRLLLLLDSVLLHEAALRKHRALCREARAVGSNAPPSTPAFTPSCCSNVGQCTASISFLQAGGQHPVLLLLLLQLLHCPTAKRCLP